MTIDRREFLGKAAIYSLALLGMGGTKIYSIENSPLWEISDEALLKRISGIKRSQPFRFGLCPGSGHDFDLRSSTELSHFSENVLTPYYIGYFPKLEFLARIPNYAEKFIEDITLIHEKGAIPYIAIDTLWRFNEIPDNITSAWALVLGQLPFEITVRPYYEANAPWFAYGLSPEEFKTAFSDFSIKIREARKEYKTNINLSFNVHISGYEDWPFKEYIPGDFNVFDEIHFDGYFRWPGTIKISDLNYWKYGKLAPEQVFRYSFETAINLTGGQKSIGVSEAGSACSDKRTTSQWLGHAALFTMSYKEASTFVHFGENKLYKKGEYDWRPSKELIEVYGDLSKLYT